MGSEITNAKISGYLEKKGKLRVVGGWKKYWFVLEGRLLLYYRSKEEYEAISPCKGSISLGPPCSIKPALASTCIFQIEMRSNTIILRAESRLEQDKWMQGILGALNLNTNSPTKMSHFRYSADDLAKNSGLSNISIKKHRSNIFSRQNTMPSRAPHKKESYTEKSKLNVLEKLRKMSSDSYVARSLENVSKAASKASPKLPKSQNLQRMLLNSSLQSLNSSSDTIVVHNAHELSHKDSDKLEKSGEIVLNEETGIVLIDKVEYFTPLEISSSTTELKKEIYTEPTVQVLMRDSPTKKTDHNKNSVLIENTEYEPYKSQESLSIKPSEENLYDECQYAKRSSKDSMKDKLYSTIDDPYSVPQLPPRIKSSSTEQLPLLDEIKKPLKRRGGTFRKITNFVSSDGQKKSSSEDTNGHGTKLGRKRSFVNRVLSKITTTNKGPSDGNQSVRIEEERAMLEKERQRIPEAQVLKEMQEILYQRRQEIERIIPSSSNTDLSQKRFSEEIANDGETSQSNDKVFNYEYDEHAYYEPTFPKPKDFRPDLPPRQKLTENYYHNHPCTPLPIEPFYIPRLKLKRPRSIQKMDQPQKLKTIDEILDDLDKEKLQSLKISSREYFQESRECLVDQNLSDIYNNNNTPSDELVTLRKDYVAGNESLTEAEKRIDFRYSDDLNNLLEELCKVTNAPILNTNATSSLVYHPDASDEWTKLIPMRKRTYSDPDYDVPRPHSSAKFVSHHPISLQNLPRAIEEIKQFEEYTPCIVEETPPPIKEFNPSSIEEDRSVTSYTSHQYAKELPLPMFKTSSSVVNKFLEDYCNTTTQKLLDNNEDYDSTDIELQQINEQKLLNNNNNLSLINHPKEYETQQVCHVLVEDFTYAGPRSFVSFDHMLNECEHTLQMKGTKVLSAVNDDHFRCGRNDREDIEEDEVFADSLEPFDLEQISTEF